MREKKKLNKGSSGQNRKSGEAFLHKYAQRDGVMSTESGLLYKVIESAEGIHPAERDTVVVNQRVLSAAGSIIADTYKSGVPDKFTMTEAIPGLREGLQLMAEGARFEFVVPPSLAWGKRGADNKIGPNEVLIFDVRLVEVTF
ncbi:FKBP-type peptidyl-prolyl cis-trans isomerase [Teredinibacter haidensis]|uniref:FKBP-type peptidyl-prolyl cis-trans isomerase n=1 Tax=Teredinibacter haidensis TaxID=2731755 RepID=UPI000948F900|nr:FKBP-type peptidyl-prolyl cis-trans isomerase [Teredinibacter haidensis]